MANGRFNTIKEYIEERFALNLLYLFLIVVGDACRADYLLINKDILSLNS
jgi:hypothetical protein